MSAPDAPPCAACPRRAVLAGLLAGVSLSACGLPTGKGPTESAPGDSPGADSPAQGCSERAPDPETWIEIPLADYPALLEPGGVAEVQRPDALLDVLIVHRLDGCFIAAWRICTHGACPVYWEAAAEELWCDCHGSRFGQDGAILEGPATRALSTFTVLREGDVLWLDRGL